MCICVRVLAMPVLDRRRPLTQQVGCVHFGQRQELLPLDRFISLRLSLCHAESSSEELTLWKDRQILPQEHEVKRRSQHPLEIKIGNRPNMMRGAPGSRLRSDIPRTSEAAWYAADHVFAHSPHTGSTHLEFVQGRSFNPQASRKVTW